MLSEATRRMGSRKSTELRVSPLLSHSTNSSLSSSLSVSRAPSPLASSADYVLLPDGTVRGDPSGLSNLQLLSASSGLGSSTPTTLEAVRRTLQGRRQQGGLPIAVDELEGLQHLTISLPEDEMDYSRADEVVGDTQAGGGDDVEMNDQNDAALTDDSDLTSLSESESTHSASPSPEVTPHFPPPQHLPGFLAGLMTYDQCVAFVAAQGGKTGEGLLKAYRTGALNKTLEAHAIHFWKMEDGAPAVPQSVKDEVCDKAKVLAQLLERGERPAAYEAGLLPLQVFLSQFVILWHPLRGPDPGMTRKSSNNLVIDWTLVRSFGADSKAVDRLEEEPWRESESLLIGWTEKLKEDYGNFLSLSSFACASAERAPALVQYKSLRGGTGSFEEIKERLFLTSAPFKPVRDLITKQLRTGILRLCKSNPGSLPLDYDWYIEADTPGYGDMIISAADQLSELNNISRISVDGSFSHSTLALRWQQAQMKVLNSELKKLDEEVRRGLATDDVGDFSGVSFGGAYIHQTDRSNIPREQAQREAEFVVRMRKLNDLCLVRSTEGSLVKRQDGTISDVSVPHNSNATAVREEIENWLIDHVFQPVIDRLLPLSTADPYVAPEDRSSLRPKPLLQPGLRASGNRSGITLRGRSTIEGFVKIDRRSVNKADIDAALYDDRDEEELEKEENEAIVEDYEKQIAQSPEVWDPLSNLEDLKGSFVSQASIDLTSAKNLFTALERYGVEWQDLEGTVGSRWGAKTVLENRQTIRIVLSAYIDKRVISHELATELFRLYDIFLVCAAKLESPTLFTLAPDAIFRRTVSNNTIVTEDVQLFGLVMSEMLSCVHVSMVSMTFWSDTSFINYPSEKIAPHDTLRSRFFEVVASAQGGECSRENCTIPLNPSLPVRQTKNHPDSPAYSCTLSRLGFLRELATPEMKLPAEKITYHWPISPCPSGLVMTTVSWASLSTIVSITKVEHSRCKNSRDRHPWHQTWVINGQESKVFIAEDVDDEEKASSKKKRGQVKDENEEDGSSENDEGTGSEENDVEDDA